MKQMQLTDRFLDLIDWLHEAKGQPWNRLGFRDSATFTTNWKQNRKASRKVLVRVCSNEHLNFLGPELGLPQSTIKELRVCFETDHIRLTPTNSGQLPDFIREFSQERNLATSGAGSDVKNEDRPSKIDQSPDRRERTTVDAGPADRAESSVPSSRNGADAAGDASEQTAAPVDDQARRSKRQSRPIHALLYIAMALATIVAAVLLVKRGGTGQDSAGDAGQHIAENGRELADASETAIDAQSADAQPAGFPSAPASGAEMRQFLQSLSNAKNGWLIAYEPSQLQAPGASYPGAVEDIASDLRTLKNTDCISGVITFGSDAPLTDAPAAATDLGLGVVMGIYINPSERNDPIWTKIQIDLAVAKKDFVDAYIYGHADRSEVELTDLKNQISYIRQETGKPTTTSLPIHEYIDGDDAEEIRQLGDFLCPDVDIKWIVADADKHIDEIKMKIARLADVTDRPVLLKIVAAPSAPALEGFSPELQARFFRAIFAEIAPDLPSGFYLSFAFAFDSKWKTSESGNWLPSESHLGLFDVKRFPKPVVQVFRDQHLKALQAPAQQDGVATAR